MLKKRKKSKILERNRADFLRICHLAFKAPITPNKRFLVSDYLHFEERSRIRF